jgi:hypothetical protein
MNRQNWTLLGTIGLGAGLGAGLMYLLDPQGGRGRRALARDKAVSKLKTGSESALSKSRHLSNRTKGLVSVAGSKLRRNKKDDDLLAVRDLGQTGTQGLSSVGLDNSLDNSLDNKLEQALDQANREFQTTLP